MKTETDGTLLRIFLSERDEWQGKPLFEAILEMARSHGMAGATVLRGIEGFGAHSTVHTTKILRLAENLPVVVEIVDQKERIAAILPSFDEMMTEGVMTTEDVHIITYRQNTDHEA